jgi:hypothetical protein
MIFPIKTRAPATMIILITVSLCAAFYVDVLLSLLFHPGLLNSDFMAFWSFPRFAASHPIGQIYDGEILQNFQQRLYPGFHSFYPYLYPPPLLLATWWLRFFSFAGAQAVWTLLGLAFFVAATLAFFRAHRWLTLAALLACPASLFSGVTGETAYFTTGLLLFGFALLPARPVLAGIAFGLLTLKPQLSVLIPFFLIGRRDWAALFTAGAVALLIIALALLAFPAALWPHWLRSLSQYQTEYYSGHGINLNIVVTPAANLITLGVPVSVAWAVQLGFASATAVTAMLLAQRAPYRLAVAGTLTAAFIAVPHAYTYDTIALAAALVLCLEHKPVSLPQALFGSAVYVAPLLLLTPAHHWFLYAVPETLLFGHIIALAFARPDGAILGDEPNAVSLPS